MNTDMRHLYVVAYDIPDDKRRTKIAATLETFGERLQYSVFLVSARPAKLVRLRDALGRIVETKEDSIAVFDLGVHAENRIKRLVSFVGLSRELSPANIIII